MRKIDHLFAACVSASLIACGGGSSGVAPTAASPPTTPPPVATGAPSLARTVVLAGLANPWDLAFTPDGALLYTERGRGLSVRRTDGSTALLFRPADLVAEGQSGFNGVAVDPDFAANRRVYVYMASNAGGERDNRVIRLVVDAGYTAVSDRSDIVAGISYKRVAAPGAPGGAGAHNGGRIRFGPDGFLYITTGDTHHPAVPQSPSALGGKVLRVRTDGSAAPGNAAPAGFDARVYAYGFRNPQGITFRPAGALNAGQPYISEHGPGHSDEVTALSAGGNGGWDPGCRDDPARYCGYGSNQADGSPTPMTDLAKFPAALRPLWNNNGRSQGMSGSSFLSGAQWRDWNGALVVAFLAGQRLEILRLSDDGSLASTTPVFATLGVRLRAVVLGNDGALYVSTDGKSGGDEIWRVTAQ
jgi:glucose/arabinose dehydrogenase